MAYQQFTQCLPLIAYYILEMISSAGAVYRLHANTVISHGDLEVPWSRSCTQMRSSCRLTRELIHFSSSSASSFYPYPSLSRLRCTGPSSPHQRQSGPSCWSLLFYISAILTTFCQNSCKRLLSSQLVSLPFSTSLYPFPNASSLANVL